MTAAPCSVSGSAGAVTVTVCASYQFAMVKRRAPGTRRTSPVGLTREVMVTSPVGTVFSTTV